VEGNYFKMKKKIIMCWLLLDMYIENNKSIKIFTPTGSKKSVTRKLAQNSQIHI
jgi:hypothetical protein